MTKTIRIKGDGSFPLEVVGESHYQHNLVTINGPVPKEDRKRYDPSEWEDDEDDDYEDPQIPAYEASLVREPTNKYDKNAVKVIINNLQVGYLSRDDAALYVRMLAGLKLPKSTVIVVDARILGGYNKNKPNYGVWLDLSANEDVAAQLKAASRTARPDYIGPLLIILLILFTVFCVLPMILGTILSLLGYE